MPTDYNREFDRLKRQLIVEAETFGIYCNSTKEFIKSDLIRLAGLINNKLDSVEDEKLGDIGRTISWELLRNMLNYRYIVPVPTNRKIVKSLSKVAIFLNFRDWDDFLKDYKERGTPREIKDAIKGGLNELSKFSAGKACDIYQYFDANFSPIVQEDLDFKTYSINILSIKENTAIVIVDETINPTLINLKVLGKINLDSTKYFYEMKLQKNKWKIRYRYKLIESKEFFQE